MTAVSRHSPSASTSSAAEETVLVLQGGGALGAYQAGVFESLSTAYCEPAWVAGISIGAINAALIAGNPAEQRLQRLRAFWDLVSSALPAPALVAAPLRAPWNEAQALQVMLCGVPGFFTPRIPPAPLQPRGTLEAISYYDTRPLQATLERLVDFDRINSGATRLSVGAVNVRTGNFAYFDSAHQRIDARHIMASGALPPGFGAVAVDGRWYWDGGLVSNTPLAHVMRHLDAQADRPVNLFQIDLFSARGALPHTLADVAERQKDIQYSSRTRMVSDHVRERHDLHQRLRALAEHVPPAERGSAAVQALLADASDPPITLVHVIHRSKDYETQTKDYDFSRLSMVEHWLAGKDDMVASLQLLARSGPAQPGEFRVLDYRPDASAVRVVHDRSYKVDSF